MRLIYPIILIFAVGCGRMKSRDSLDGANQGDFKSGSPIDRAAANLLATKCLKCHEAGRIPNSPADITDIDDLMKKGWIIPGHPDYSPLIKAIKPGSGTMPKDGPPLTRDEFEIIYNWILKDV